MALRAGRGGPGAGRRLAPERSLVVLEGGAAELDVSRRPFLAGLDVFVFPTKAETFGLAAVEAANAGVPSVVNDLPVLREVLSYQGNPAALFVDASDHAKLSAAVCRVLEDKALSATLRDNAQGLKARYSIDAMVEEYIRILDDATNDTGLAQQASPT